LQIPDRSTATSRGRSYVRETSFHDAETLLCSTADFHDAETPLMNTGDFLPHAETPLFSALHFFPFPKHSSPPSPHHFHYQNNSVQHLFRLSPRC
jgi:hypothetical protein